METQPRIVDQPNPDIFGFFSKSISPKTSRTVCIKQNLVIRGV